MLRLTGEESISWKTSPKPFQLAASKPAPARTLGLKHSEHRESAQAGVLATRRGVPDHGRRDDPQEANMASGKPQVRGVQLLPARGRQGSQDILANSWRTGMWACTRRSSRS